MKKSNWFVLALAVVASAFLLWLWLFLSFFLVEEQVVIVM